MGVKPSQPAESHGLVPITALAAGGAGIGRVENRVWMVSGGLPGDVVDARVVKVHSRWIEARAERWPKPSPDRRPPPCPLQGRCGGCPWMPLDERTQRAWKRRIVEDALTRIGGLAGTTVAETVASPRSLGYRNKVEFAVGRDAAGRRVVGLHADDPSEGLIDVERCLLLDDEAASILTTARDVLTRTATRFEPALGDGGEPARLVIRRSAGGDTLVAVRGPDRAWDGGGAFAAAVAAAHPSVVGVVRILAPPGRRGGARTEVLAGSSSIRESLAGTTFRLPATAFFQVNPGAAEILASIVISAGRGARSVLELYGGAGAFGLALARGGASVIVVDADPEAVACGREAASAARLDARHETADVLAFLGRAPRDRAPDLVLADPPRSGLGRGVADAVARLGAARIVMVSCDPATLGRDLRTLAGHGYRVEQVTPVDLFPQTAHVESVAVLGR